MTVRPNTALLKFRTLLQEAQGAVMSKEDRAFTDDLGAVVHWLDFAERSLGDRDALLTECAGLLRRQMLYAENAVLAARIEKLLGLTLVAPGGCAPDVVVGGVQ